LHFNTFKVRSSIGSSSAGHVQEHKARYVHDSWVIEGTSRDKVWLALCLSMFSDGVQRKPSWCGISRAPELRPWSHVQAPRCHKGNGRKRFETRLTRKVVRVYCTQCPGTPNCHSGCAISRAKTRNTSRISSGPPPSTLKVNDR